MKNTLIAGLALLASLLWLTGCDKNAGSLGFDVIPPSDELYTRFCDTILFSTSSFYDDSIRSDESTFNSARPYNLLGTIVENDFGQTRASFATQVQLAKSNVDFGTAYVIDSIVFQFYVAGHYGQPESFQNFEVFKLKDSIHVDSSYYSNMDEALLFDPSDKVGEYGKFFRQSDTLVRVMLAKEKLTELTDTINLVNTASFRKAFFGFYVAPVAVKSQEALLYINLLSTQSKLTVYYRNSTDTSYLDFPVNSSSARINLFRHSYNSPVKAPFADQLADSSVVLPYMYVQGSGGVKAKLRIPDLGGWPHNPSGRKVAITKAELILKVAPRPFYGEGDIATNPFRIPSILQLAWVNTEGELKALPDQVISSSYFGGVYRSSDQSYHFLITTMVQNLVDQEITNLDYLCLFPTDSRVSGNSVVLYGGEGPDRVQLRISYTEL